MTLSGTCPSPHAAASGPGARNQFHASTPHASAPGGPAPANNWATKEAGLVPESERWKRLAADSETAVFATIGGRSLDHVIRPPGHRRRDREAEASGLATGAGAIEPLTDREPEPGQHHAPIEGVVFAEQARRGGTRVDAHRALVR